MVACNGRARDRTKIILSATGRGEEGGAAPREKYRTVIEREVLWATGRGHEGGAAPREKGSNNRARTGRQESLFAGGVPRLVKPLSLKSAMKQVLTH